MKTINRDGCLRKKLTEYLFYYKGHLERPTYLSKDEYFGALAQILEITPTTKYVTGISIQDC